MFVVQRGHLQAYLCVFIARSVPRSQVHRCGLCALDRRGQDGEQERQAREVYRHPQQGLTRGYLGPKMFCLQSVIARRRYARVRLEEARVEAAVKRLMG